MPELYFFSKVCFEIKKEHTIVQSFKWIGKDCRSNARIAKISAICSHWFYGLFSPLCDHCSNRLPLEIKKALLEQGLEQKQN